MTPFSRALSPGEHLENLEENYTRSRVKISRFSAKIETASKTGRRSFPWLVKCAGASLWEFQDTLRPSPPSPLKNHRRRTAERVFRVQFVRRLLFFSRFGGGIIL